MSGCQEHSLRFSCTPCFFCNISVFLFKVIFDSGFSPPGTILGVGVAPDLSWAFGNKADFTTGEDAVQLFSRRCGGHGKAITRTVLFPLTTFSQGSIAAEVFAR